MATMSISERRKLGLCIHGHDGYVLVDEAGLLDVSGRNVALTLRNGKMDIYCAECHRVQVRGQGARDRAKRRQRRVRQLYINGKGSCGMLPSTNWTDGG